jgi:mycothiol system anti-sigma-R factor
MADCEETLRELERFLDGELPTDEKHQVHHHLDGCLDCLQAFEFHYELKAVIRAKLLVDELPAGLRERVAACFGDLEPEPPEAR